MNGSTSNIAVIPSPDATRTRSVFLLESFLTNSVVYFVTPQLET